MLCTKMMFVYSVIILLVYDIHQIFQFILGLMGKCELLDNLTDPTPWLPVLVQTKKQETSACPKAYCRHYG